MTEHEQHFHDPANITNPEHAEHHIVSPTAVWHGLRDAAVLHAADGDGGRHGTWASSTPSSRSAIASTKMVIVILFFMHVKYQSNLIKMTVGAGFFTFLVLITMTLSDYISRAWGLW